MQRWLEHVQTGYEQTVARWDKSLRRFSVFALVLDTIDVYNSNNLTMLAASLSYYALLAIFPLLLLLISIAPIFISKSEAFDSVLRVAREYLPGADTALRGILQQVIDERGSATLVGIVTLVWSASGVFDVLQVSFNRAWRVAQPRAFWLQRLFSIAVIGVLGIFFLVSVIASSFSQALGIGLLGEANVSRELVTWGGSMLGAILAFAGFALLYKTFPNANVRWKYALLGALVAVVLWQSAKYLYELYIVHFARFNLVYGSVGAIIGLLLWGYISASIVLWGAQLTAVMGKIEKNENGAWQAELG